MNNNFYSRAIVFFVVCFLYSLLLSGCIVLENKEKSNIVVGEWMEDTFANQWSNITFTLPPHYKAIYNKDLNTIPGQVNDFLLINDDQATNISLMYVDLSFGSQLNQTPESYLSTVRQQLSNSKNKDYQFADDYERISIAGEEYSVLRTEFVFKDGSAGNTGFQDGYVRSFDNTLIVFLAVYSEEQKDSVTSFFSTIDRIQ